MTRRYNSSKYKKIPFLQIQRWAICPVVSDVALATFVTDLLRVNRPRAPFSRIWAPTTHAREITATGPLVQQLWFALQLFHRPPSLPPRDTRLGHELCLLTPPVRRTCHSPARRRDFWYRRRLERQLPRSNPGQKRKKEKTLLPGCTRTPYEPSRSPLTANAILHSDTGDCQPATSPKPHFIASTVAGWSLHRQWLFHPMLTPPCP